LDVSNNARLWSLSCNENRLEHLNLRGAAALETVYCQNNQLTTLDISSNTALSNLSCSNNNITSLIIGDDNNLAILRCDDNRLAELDVSQATELWELNCSNNQLTELNLDSAVGLVELNIENNQLTSLNLSHNTKLKEVTCANNLFPNRSAIIGLDEEKLRHFTFDPQGVSSDPRIETSTQTSLSNVEWEAIDATLNQRMATRTGPGTKFTEDHGTLPEGTEIVAYIQEETGGTAWVLVEFTKNGKLVRTYTGLKRVDADAGIPKLRQEPRTAVVSQDTPASYGPGTAYLAVPNPVTAGMEVVVYGVDKGYALIEYAVSSDQWTRSWVPDSCVVYK
jgi:uncharacterized protein YraI